MSRDASMRKVVVFDADWRFLKSDPDGAELPVFDDSSWELVRVPHDWAIKGPFDKTHDLQVITIVEDGEKKSSEHSGVTGGLPHVGKGWYRKAFSVPNDSRGKRFFIEFDGVMSNSKVYLNGEFIDSWPYGYASFCFELTDHVKFGKDNILAVRLDVKPNASRWYPGAGIYRHVRLVVVNSIHVAHWGTHITTPEVSESEARIKIQTDIQNQTGEQQQVELKTEIFDPSGKQVGSCSSRENVESTETFEQNIQVEGPMLWSTTAPRLYKAVSCVAVGGRVVDRYETDFGIRTLRFDPNNGFALNGEKLKLNGVCMHHDMGPLGAAINRRAIERQFEILKEMGCNALRTSHNPPAPEVLEICDRMGVLVIDEAFDEWRIAKCENGYNKLFDEWAEKDMRAFIRRDRNHPCVIMWSIGNEIPEQGSRDGANIAGFLNDICHDEDPSRPTTSGFNDPDRAIKNGLADVVDVPGWNYRPKRYREFHDAHPDWPTYGSETGSCVSTRGEYLFPAEEVKINNMEHESLQVSSYDMCSPSWGYAPDIEFAAQDECPFICGEFVWTGFDYLGEPTPYNHKWPSRSSYFGIIDLCGLPKDRYYSYRSKWNPDMETLHIFPHWNWEGREGEITPVHCYTNYDSAELFLNGKSQGKRRKDKNSVYDRYRLRWNDVKYEPGVVRVVAFDSDGKPVAETEMKTAGVPAQIELLPDRARISADARDLSFITVRITDADGILCPFADNLVGFDLDGPGRIVAVGNGDPTSMEPFSSDHRKAFHGLCMLIVGSAERSAGQLRIRASSEGLCQAEASVTCGSVAGDGAINNGPEGS